MKGWGSRYEAGVQALHSEGWGQSSEGQEPGSTTIYQREKVESAKVKSKRPQVKVEPEGPAGSNPDHI